MILIRKKKEFITQDIFNMLGKVITYCALLLVFGAQAQDGETLYSQLAYQEAIEKYEAKLKKDSEDTRAIYELATAYRLNNETGKAEQWYEKAVQYSGVKDVSFYYAQMLLMNGKPAKAKQWFVNYQSTLVGDEAQWVEEYVRLCSSVENGTVDIKNYEVKPVIFNSKELDFSPMYFKENLAFVSNRDGRKGARNLNDSWTSSGYTDLFIANAENGYKVSTFSKKINTSLHEGSGVYDESNKTFYFTGNNVYKWREQEDEERNIRLQLYKTLEEGDSWAKPQRLNFNNDNYSYCHPTLSKDGSKMIFASDQPGGYGGMDLWMVEKKGDSWSVPINMGDKINTPGNEVFPFMSEDEVLYFASNYHPGYGGLDVFETKSNGLGWSKPLNVGIPVNSSKDDFGLITKDGLVSGYLSSNRGGEDDIFSFKHQGVKWLDVQVINCITNKPIEAALVTVQSKDNLIYQLESDKEGRVRFEPINGITEYTVSATSVDYSTSDECPGLAAVSSLKPGSVVLGLMEGDPLPEGTDLNLCGTVINKECNYLLPNTEVTIINLCEGTKHRVTTDQEGRFNFPLKENCKYRVEVKKQYFDPVVVSFETKGEVDDCFKLNVELKSNVDLRDPALGYEGGDQILLSSGAIIELYNVYFDLDKYTIRKDALKELNWVKSILEDNADIVVEIGAHTDARATDNYNATLSDNRANEVRRWLIKNGINPNRLKHKGYGETQLKNECADGVSCSDMQHQRNRRVEFKVLQMNGEVVVSKEWQVYKR